MLLTSAQDKIEKDNYIFVATPLSAANMRVQVRKITDPENSHIEKEMSDQDYINFKAAFEGAADEAALDTWFSGLLTGMDPTAP